MRDLLLIAIVVPGCVASLRRPWIGVMLWTWLSIMNPHRYTYGIAYSAPLAATAVACTLLGLLITKERESPFKASPVTWFVMFVVWLTISWLAGLDIANDAEQWKKVIKIDFMIIIALMVLHSKQHIFALMWVCALSLGLLGAKGGVYTLLQGGGGRVWGPPGSFIEDNNGFAIALIMTIPLLRFLQMQLKNVWGRHSMTGLMLLCSVSALGSQSRGALLAISAMAFYFWWNGKNKVRMGLLLLMIAIPLIVFMPDSWSERMSTINTYEQDASSMGRIGAWVNAWNIGFNYPFGVGFNAATPELFAKFSPNASAVQGAHSIYFLALGNHGFIGLALFLAIWVSTWRAAGWLRSEKNIRPETKWCAELGSMCQVSLIAYFVGGAFLNLTYFDLPYNIMVLVILTRVWVEKQRWKTEPEYVPGWKTIPGLAPARRLG